MRSPAVLDRNHHLGGASLHVCDQPPEGRINRVSEHHRPRSDPDEADARLAASLEFAVCAEDRPSEEERFERRSPPRVVAVKDLRLALELDARWRKERE